ncbi:MAG: peptidoglycan DD-metalloendopeptidase family protein [Actinomycetota bacterium]|nr:peptidoglycan DD-metalloendopeptidase family protein [Actinomycetota bacterium]
MKVTAGFVLFGLVALMSLPMVFAGGDGPAACAASRSGAPSGQLRATDGSPTILGHSGLTATDLIRWWTVRGKGQPPRLGMAINDVIAAYLDESASEHVRGDLAFAQAVLETGWFTNTDTSINNFAGLGHYDNARSGLPFPTPTIGVRAHIQLLKKYAAGNATRLALPDVSPNAGARAATWPELATRWATAPNYWTKIDALYQSMSGRDRAGTFAPETPGRCSSGLSVGGGSYALPVDIRWYRQHPAWFTKPHHDYPAADIPVPAGTPVLAAATGSVTTAPAGGACGLGVIVHGDDGATYTYCHGSDGGQIVRPGQRVRVGQLIMHSGSSGNSTGPHLHFAISVNGQNRCPQPFLVALAKGLSTDPKLLPAAGCTY